MALIQITDLTFTYPGSFDPVFEHVSFQLDTDWRLGLTGRNGRGKTTLLRLLQGQYPHQGTITAPGGFEYFPYPIPDAALTPLELLECSFPDVPQWRLRRELAPLFVTDDALYRPFHTFRRRAGEDPAGAAFRARGPVSAHRRANEPSRRDGPRTRQPVSGQKVRLSARLARPRVFGRLRRPHPVHQSRRH